MKKGMQVVKAAPILVSVLPLLFDGIGIGKVRYTSTNFIVFA